MDMTIHLHRNQHQNQQQITITIKYQSIPIVYSMSIPNVSEI